MGTGLGVVVARRQGHGRFEDRARIDAARLHASADGDHDALEVAAAGARVVDRGECQRDLQLRGVERLQVSFERSFDHAA